MISSCSNEEDTLKVDDLNLTQEEIFTRDAGPTSCYDQSVIPIGYVCSFIGSWNGSITLDDYPGCTFQVSSIFNKCTNPQTGQHVLYIEGINLVSHDCQAYNDAVDLAQQSGTLDAFSAEFDGELVQATTQMIGNQNLGPFGAAIVNYRTASCVTYCYIVGSGKKDGSFGPVLFERSSCGTACCFIHTEFYYSYSCECIQSYSVDYTDESIECDVTLSVRCGPPDYLYTSACVYRCDYLVN